MIVVKIELWPLGFERQKREIGLIARSLLSAFPEER